MKLKIDKEFKELIPPLKPEEIERLEKSILDEGIRDKLVVWKGTVVDGHNRYDIATRHGLSFQITEKEFDTREDVVNWIINNQLGRRNLTEQQKMYLRGKRYENEKKIVTNKDGSNQYIKEVGIQNDHQPKYDYPNNRTARKIADEYGVGPSTIQRDAWYSKGVDVLPEETKEKIFTGEETVDSHLKHIKEKTGLQKATELECAWLVKRFHIPVIDIPERYRARIAAALLALSVFTVVMHSSDMLRVFKGNGRTGAKTVNIRTGTRRNREKETFKMAV